jgi:hypothetical protein
VELGGQNLAIKIESWLDWQDFKVVMISVVATFVGGK